jgi:GntR family transcriptional regulator
MPPGGSLKQEDERMASINISIKTGDPRPIFKQIVDGISMAIATGALAPGDKLPSVRGIQLNINPNTVAKAYTELTSQGLVDARQGLGLFASAPKHMLSKEERLKRLQNATRRCATDVVHLHFSDEEVLRSLDKELRGIRGAKARSA